MIITADMMIAKGSVDFQMDIFNSVAASGLDTANAAQAIAAATAGLDLIWIARKFADDPLVTPQLIAAKRAAEQALQALIDVPIGVYNAALSAYQLACAALGLVDPAVIAVPAVQLVKTVSGNLPVLAEAAAFTAAFSGQ